MTMKKWMIAPAVLVLLAGTGMSISAAQNNGEPRLLYNGDEQSWWYAGICPDNTDPAAIRRTLEEEVVDKLAEAGVDQVSICMWSWFKCLGSSSVVERRDGPPEFWDAWDALYEAGGDPVQIMLDRCHSRKMTFLCGMRMNDRHPDATCPKGRFIMDNPQWQLKGVRYATAIDYQYEPVRQNILDYIEDMLTRYDVDGVEFDYMRMCHMFEPGTGPQHADKLTDFTRKTRALLDAAAASRARERLLLGVRVPATLQECHYLGFDVETWIKEGLLDYVCPSRFHQTALNCPVEDFVALARQTSCKVYPSVHWVDGTSMLPVLAGKGGQITAMETPKFRAAARNFFAFGADGIQTYNCFSFGAVRWVAAFIDPATRENGSREYTYYPYLYSSSLGPEETDFLHKSVMILPRIKQVPPPPSDNLCFRITETPGDPAVSATLNFRAVGLADGETLEIAVNHHRVPAPLITRSEQQMFEDLPYHDYSVDLDPETLSPFLIRGDNTLTIALRDDYWVRDGQVTVGDLRVDVDEVADGQGQADERAPDEKDPAQDP